MKRMKTLRTQILDDIAHDLKEKEIEKISETESIESDNTGPSVDLD